MSASEKLRALDVEIGETFHEGTISIRGVSAEKYVALRNALPLIADVIEAAERIRARSSQDYPAVGVQHALTALEAHLTPEEET